MNGAAKAVVKELELHDEWMAECFVTVTVKSHEPIDFEVGDYIDYRDERYSINYDPTILKKARRDTYGEGFVYDNIKFVSQQDEIVRCDFNDIVLSDNNMHYTMLPTFPFYCETVEDLLDRIQANLEELYPGEWIVIALDQDRARQRGMCVGREQAFLDAYSRYIGSVEFDYEKKGIALTANNNNCWEALKWANDQFGLNFFVRGRVVVVGTNGAVTGRKFRYGKGNGLYEIERISDSEQKIITRLRGYGAETNLPNHYYANLSKRCFATVIDYTGLNNEYYILDIDYNSSLFKKKDDEGNHWVTRIENDSEYGWANLYVLAYDHEEVAPSDGKTVVYPQTGVSFTIGQKIYFIGGIDINQWPASNTEQAHQYMPDNMAINRLMLPGFPKKSLAEWVEEHMDDERIQQMVEAGFTFSEDVYRPYIDSPNVSVYGIRPASIYFDGSDAESEDIHPTIEGMEWHGRRVDVIVAADQITDNGILPDDAKDSEKQMNVVIPKAGFELDELLTDDATIEMKDGMCGARSLKIKKVKEDESKNNWICTVQRAYDDTLKLYFPYRDFQIQPGDHFVLTGIELPDSYIEAASEKLFFACVDALLANHAPRYTFQPRIDEIWMQRQHDTAIASGGAVESLHDTLKSGDLFSFADDDLLIDAKIIIDVLTIKENGNNGIPTYEVTLRDEKIASAIDKRLDKITSVISGFGGGMTSRQYSGMIEEEGSDLFLSKVYDDVAQGVIGFLKGAWFGVKNWFIDGNGNANFNDTTVNGLLKAYNAMINNVRSTNYTGDGIMDSGWRITNEYEGYNSKATFDFLYIRKKAIFEELEIRKLTHIGGNFCLSGASGRAWKVDYYDADGNLLGYDTYSVPWTLASRLMILFRPHNQNNRYLGRRKRIQRRLTDAEKLLVRTVRVYMYNDDGTTTTMNNWTVGAQARCQTFNVEKQMEFDGSSWKGTKVGNTYWYRLVTAVSAEPVKLEDGQLHHWIEFSVDPTQEGHAYAWADALSDLPSRGDVFVQLGHRTRQDQSNVIMLETANEDSPAIKMYAGVNWWSYGDNNLVALMSPNGWRVVSNKFEWITQYGERFQTTVNRGVWVQIPVDDQGKRKCYYNDMVSHNGAYWRCIVGTGSYTTDEPSESSSAWSKEVYAAIAPYVKLSEALVAIPCEKNSVATSAFSKTIVPKLMLTNLECTLTSVTLEGADSHVYKSGNNIVVSYAQGASVTNKDYTVTLEGDRDGNHYIASDKLSVYAIVRGNDGYEVTAEPNTFIFSQNEHEPYAINIDKSETGNSSLQVSVKMDGVAQAFRITNVVATGRNSSGQAVGGVTATYSNTSGRVWITNIPNNVEKGELAITVAYGSNATHTLVLQFYCNLIGTWKEQVVGDTKTEVAERMLFDICDETGQVIGTSTLANYVKNSSGSTASLQKQTAALSVEDARLEEELGTTKRALEKSIDDAESTLNTKIDNTKTTLEGEISAGDSALSTALANAKTELEGDVNTVSTSLATYEQTNDRAVAALGTRMSNAETSITNTNTRVDTAEGSIQAISSELETVDGKFGNYYTKTETSSLVSQSISSATQGMVTTSNFEQTASSFSLVTTTTAQGYANTAESNAKSAAQGYANTAQSNVEEKLSQTGIDINQNQITIKGGKINFVDQYGQPANIYFDNDSNKYIFGYLRAKDGADLDGDTVYVGGIHTSTTQVIGTNVKLGIDGSGNTSGYTVNLGRTEHKGYAYFNDDAIFKDDVEFQKKATFGGDIEVKDELTVYNSSGAKYLRIYFDSSGNVCIGGTFQHPSSRYKLVVDGGGFLKLTE